MAAAGMRSFWMPAEDATPEQIAEHEAFLEKALVPDELVTTRIDVNDFLHTKLEAIQRHVTQISGEHPFMRFGVEGWREFGGVEAFVLRESRIHAETPRDGPLRRPVDDAAPQASGHASAFGLRPSRSAAPRATSND